MGIETVAADRKWRGQVGNIKVPSAAIFSGQRWIFTEAGAAGISTRLCTQTLVLDEVELCTLEPLHANIFTHFYSLRRGFYLVVTLDRVSRDFRFRHRLFVRLIILDFSFINNLLSTRTP